MTLEAGEKEVYAMAYTVRGFTVPARVISKPGGGIEVVLGPFPQAVALQMLALGVNAQGLIAMLMKGGK
jgi:hypothetical protein